MPRHRTVFSILTAGLVLAALEGLSFASFYLIDRIYPGRVLELAMDRHFRDKINPRELADFVERSWDPDLGWTNPTFHGMSSVNKAGITWTASFDDLGAREHPHYSSTLIAATFGDSFTHGHEVGNDQTWQSYASSELKSTVLNFGVGAYGTLQAVMRAERFLKTGPVAPVTILGIFENNLERSVMAFRPFLYPDDVHMTLAFMPTMRLLDGKVVEFENPWQDQDANLEELRDLAVAVADHDLWAETMTYRMSFPYTFAILRVAYQLLKPGVRGNDLWRSPEGQAIMSTLVRRFVTAVRDKGSVPAILFIPGRYTLRQAKPPPYISVRNSLRSQFPEIMILDVSERDFDRAKFNILPFEGHASPYGNRVIAELVAEALRDFDPVPFKSPP